MSDGKKVSFQLNQASADRLDQMMKKAGMSEIQVISNALQLYEALMLKAEKAGTCGGKVFTVVKQSNGTLSDEEAVF